MNQDASGTRRAECSCGALVIECEGQPLRVSVCHCLACQRRSGGPFGAQARYAVDRVRATGESKAFVRVADSGKSVTSHFCPTCGTTVYYELELLPGMVGVPIGGFADPAFPAPRVSIYEERQHPWVSLSGEVEHLD